MNEEADRGASPDERGGKSRAQFPPPTSGGPTAALACNLLLENKALHRRVVAEWRQKGKELDKLRIPNPLTSGEKRMKDACNKLV
jgi:hypothetical protein